ncbi:carboxypeptidase regulatory-like domain-containing protein, partial [Actimicrobium sp. CCI2.3]|uniref:carboxypeptidase regulatory-like domain-containing protein n=2 Tax=Actimicrobium sp. CCI2.3 TaxID=3048616 RepID=UPI002B251FAA
CRPPSLNGKWQKYFHWGVRNNLTTTAAMSPITFQIRHPDNALVAANGPVTVDAIGGNLVSDVSAYTVYLNNVLIAPGSLVATPTSLRISAPLTDGVNMLLIFAPDEDGNVIEAQLPFGAGVSDVTGRVVDKAGNPVAGAKVVAALGDDAKLAAETTTDTGGNYKLGNFPTRTVLISVIGPSGLPGTTSGVPGTTFPTTALVELDTPVATLNNDFSQGILGWKNPGNAKLTLIPHTETVGPTTPQSTTAALLHLIHQWLPFPAAYAQEVIKKDLQISTNGKGPKTVSYTFTPTSTTSSIKLRYRFQTSEFPTFYNTRYNDAFDVRIRSEEGPSAAASGTMNGLGASAFDAGGSTAWKELFLTLPPKTDGPAKPVQIDITVANVGDGVVDSSVILDAVGVSKVDVTSAALFDIDDTALTHFSAAPHPFFNGNTHVHATFSLNGPEEDKVTSLALQVFQGGVLKASGELVDTLKPSIYVPFGSKGSIVFPNKALAFEIPSSALRAINTVADDNLTLKLEVKTEKGETAVKEIGSYPLLALWTGTARYGERNSLEGGDGWARPSSLTIFSRISATYGDFSNMHGGAMAPHASHRTGQDADGWFPGYNARDAATAAKMVDILNTPGVRLNAKIAYVTYTAKAGNAFYDAIKGVTLADGRPAASVIRPFAGHTTHFHVNTSNPVKLGTLSQGSDDAPFR